MTGSPAAETKGGRLRRTYAIAPAASWAYERRLFPMATFLALGASCCVWAVASELDSPIEATTLAILGSVALSIIFVDPAAAITAPSVLPLAWRRGVPVILGLGLATASWLMARSLAAALGPAPWPGRYALLEWSTIALSQLAVAAVTSRRRPDAHSFGPGILLALVWYLVVAVPRFHQVLFDPPEHLFGWLGVLVTAAVISRIASLDPAHRLRRGATS